MKFNIHCFVLLITGLITIAQQSVYYPNALPWMGPVNPFYAQPYPYYPYHNGRFNFDPSIDQRERNHFSREEMGSSSRYRPNNAGYRTQSNNEDIKSDDDSEYDDVHTGSGTLNVYPLDYEKRPRGKTGGNALGRFFGTGLNIGTGATGNYLLRTSFTFVTSTGTLCFATSCIPASLFAAGSSNVFCGRRKRGAELLGDLNISPDNVEKLVPTVPATIRHIKFDSHSEKDVVSPILMSSFTDNTQETSGLRIIQGDYERKKRFLFVLTTTITTYSFLTSTYTSTISPAAPAALTCRPAGIGLC